MNVRRATFALAPSGKSRLACALAGRGLVWICFAALLWLAWAPTASSCKAATPDDSASRAAARRFDEAIAPLLAKHCLGCHNPTEEKGKLDLTRREAAIKGGESGAALAPGKPEDSLLWTHVRDEHMPPKAPLSAEEQALLKHWIADGAAWGTDPIDPFRYTSETRAGYDWWSLQPLLEVAPPEVRSRAIVSNPIDSFVLATLEARGLEQNPPADRRALLRRVTFDLIGLPPTPAEIREFEADTSARAYEKVVERLLASPHFGERWARHWLDIVRFAESNGFERDLLRPDAWPYRDWVIAALNADMPYDQFCRLQLAGDALAPQDPAATVATGFLVAGPLDDVGKAQQSVAMKAVVRQDELEDIVSATCQTFLGLTVHCARCHDHKFDPITQREYYRLCASLAGVEHGKRELKAFDPAELERLASRVASLEAALAALEAPARAAIAQARKGDASQTRHTPTPWLGWDFTQSLTSVDGSLETTLFGAARRDAEGLRLDGRTAYALSAPLKRNTQAKTLAAWVKIADLKQRGGGVIGVQTLDGASFDSLVFGEREPGQWMAGSNFFARTQSFGGAAEDATPASEIHLAIVYDTAGTITCYRQGVLYGKPYKSNGPLAFEQGKSQVMIGLRHAPADGSKFFAGIVTRAELFDRALSADEVASLAGACAERPIGEAELVERLTDAARLERANLRSQLQTLRLRQTQLMAKTVYCVAPRQPDATHLLHRGNPGDPREALTPGGVAAVPGVDANFHLTGDSADGARREKLAAWITSSENPLFARVIVNRLWHYHFGVGIVDTPSDLGFNGGRPTHPELLDFLALELIRGGWSLKHIHRLIVCSATYRQASAARREASEIDTDNRLLWRKSRQRLDAETMRDALLSVAGELNPALGGPGFRDFTTHVHNSQFYFPIDPEGPEFNRRSIYRTWVRSGRNRLLDTFDCPDPSTKTPVRAVTTTPLQSLSLLNNSFVLRMAERCAARIEREAGGQPSAQVERLFQLAYGRAPGQEELEEAGEFVQQHGLAALCRVVFNSNEFLYLD